MNDIFDICISYPSVLNEELFESWINGVPVEEAAKNLQSQPDVEAFQLSHELLAASVADQYAQFTLLDSAMMQPDVFVNYPSNYILDWKLRKKLVECYYSLDDALCRELIGSKLSARFRRDLADVAERCGIRLRSCRRQYENLRRVARFVEDTPGHLCEIIRRYFVLPLPLAEVYAAMIFLCVNRFETSKRCFSGATFADFTYCAEQLMTYWTNSNNQVAKLDSPVDLELDFEFCGELKVLKLLAEKQTYLDRHKSLVIRQISSSVSELCLNGVETNFKSLSKAIITIATGLSHAKEVRDLFLDIIEKVVDVVVGAQWTYQEFSNFLTSYDETLRILPPAKSSSFQRCWTRFFAPFKSISLRFYHLPLNTST
uniref:Acidic fibroblast growth factor intracellular-binding protein n=1 Tax=Mesocestoides corti TaxID=53468 RepID=A0A5K3ENC1_MESCO